MEIEGLGAFKIDAEAASRLGLAGVTDVDPQTAERVARAALVCSARTAALRLLERRPRSRAELEAALRRRVPREAAAAVVAGLAREGWVDDARFARAWISDRLALRPMGRRRIAAELLRRGVSVSIVEQQLGAMLPPDREEEEALALAHKRWLNLRGLPPNVARRRLAAWLLRRGYSGGVVARALRSTRGQGPDGTDDGLEE